MLCLNLICCDLYCSITGKVTKVKLLYSSSLTWSQAKPIMLVPLKPTMLSIYNSFSNYYNISLTSKENSSTLLYFINFLIKSMCVPNLYWLWWLCLEPYTVETASDPYYTSVIGNLWWVAEPIFPRYWLCWLWLMIVIMPGGRQGTSSQHLLLEKEERNWRLDGHSSDRLSLLELPSYTKLPVIGKRKLRCICTAVLPQSGTTSPITSLFREMPKFGIKGCDWMAAKIHSWALECNHLNVSDLPSSTLPSAGQLLQPGPKK